MMFHWLSAWEAASITLDNEQDDYFILQAPKKQKQKQNTNRVKKWRVNLAAK